MILYMGVVLYAPAIALEALTGINKIAAILGIGKYAFFESSASNAEFFNEIFLFRFSMYVLFDGRWNESSFDDGCVPVSSHVCSSIQCDNLRRRG